MLLKAGRAACTVEPTRVGTPWSSRAQFLANDAPQGVLEELSPPLDILSEGLIDEHLLVAASSGVDLVLEPLEEIIVEADGDSRLPLGDRNHRSPLGLAEVVLFPHVLISYRRRPLPVAAELGRMRSPRQV